MVRQNGNWNSITMDSELGEHDGATEFDLGVDNVDRQLVSLRIGNESEAGGGDGDVDAYAYRPSGVVTRMHRAPRGIGHTNRIASLVVETPTGGNDYVGGLKLFVGFFIIAPFVIWILSISVLKLKHEYVRRTESKEKQIPTPKTVLSDDPNAKTPSPKPIKVQTTKQSIPLISWVAGGDVIDMHQLSRAGVSRKERKRLVLRSWRIQSTFLSVSILIPVLSVVMLECGWKPLESAMQEIQELNSEVESLAYRGRDAVDRLEYSKQELFADNELVRSILDYSYANGYEPDRKAFNKDDSGRRQNDYHEFVEHNKENRRAQFFDSAQATNPPTFFITSDFDFDLPWAETTTLPPTEQINGEEGNSPEDILPPSTSVEGFFNSSSSSFPASGIFIEEWCPDAVRVIETEELNYWVDSINSLTKKTQTIHQIFNSLEGSFLPREFANSLSSDTSPSTHTYSPFEFVTDTTSYVDDSIDWFLANDWLLKLLVLVLNVVNGLLLANVYFFSKNNVIHQPTRLYVAYVLVPLFVAATVSIVVVTVAAGLAVLVNSDFCSGGSGGGPQGTIQEAILTLQEQHQLNGEGPNEALGLVYDAVDYYWRGCLSENPLEFLEEFSDEVDDAVAKVNEFTTLLQIAESNSATNSVVSQPEQNGSIPDTSNAAARKVTFSVLDKACHRDMSFLSPSVHDLKRQVDKIRTNIHKLSNTMSCAQVSPLLRRVSHGAVCIESPQGLAVLWGTSFGIGILCFVLLTVRAALYNSVKYKKRRPKKPRRIVEKEFDEYKEFMGKYFGEEATKKWNIDGVPLPPTQLELEFDDDIELKGTFDTAKSSKESGDGSLLAGSSEIAGIFIRKMELDDSSFGSEYDSECSDDENSSDSDSENGDDLSSAIGSFLSESKSIAMNTIHSLRNVKSLLSGPKRNKNPAFRAGNSNRKFGDRNIDDSSEEDVMDYGNEVFFSHKADEVSELGIENDDIKSVANSISDESLYLPTPDSKPEKSTNGAPLVAKFEKKSILTLSKDGRFSDEGDANEEDELFASHSLVMARKSVTHTNAASSLTPWAPRKPMPFLARTFYSGKNADGNYTDEELSSLVQPKQLAKLNSFRSKRGQDIKHCDKNQARVRKKYSSRR